MPDAAKIQVTCFFCTAPQSPRRGRFAKTCYTWWVEHGYSPNVLTPATLECDLSDFNLKRRLYAENHAKTSLYILTDDDCLPEDGPAAGEHGDSVQLGLETLRRYDGRSLPSFGILSLWPLNATIIPWTGHEGYQPYADDEVMEHVSVGGVRLIRRGLAHDWLMQSGPGYDREHAEMLRSAGHRVGYLRGLYHIHLGEGHTELWRPLPQQSEMRRLWGS